jgi:N-acetylglucosamine-6-sulfatase
VRRGALLLAGALLVSLFPSPHADVVALGSSAAPRLPLDRPNILLLVSDDQQMATFTRTLMPSVFSRLVDRGVRFDRFYVNSSLCCPSRSEILTGLTEQHTGVDDNNVPLNRPTIVEALHDLGYRTMLSGKYLNSLPCDPRPEFDRWVCQFQNGDSGLSLVDPTLNVDGTDTTFSGFTTQIEANFVSDFIRSTPRDRPFFAMYTPTSPHLPANDPRYASMPVTPNRPPNFDEDTAASGKPFYMRRPPMPADEIARNDRRFEAMSRAVRALDDDIGRILASLGDRARDTLVIFLSDNGFLLGEHRREAKIVPYEESVNTPFVVRFPAVATGTPSISDALVSNIDIAPTIADLVGIPWHADGKSLVPLLTHRSASIRPAVLINWCEGIHPPCPGNQPTNVFIEPLLGVPSYFGVVTRRYKYVEYRTGERELYDLANDPYELVNHAGDPAWSSVRGRMAGYLFTLTSPPPVDTTIVTGPQGAVDTRAFTFRYFTASRFATYRCRLDRDGVAGSWRACDGQTDQVGPLRDGDYVFRVAGTNERGRTDPSAAARAFSIHTTGPPVTVDAGPPRHLRERSVRLRFSSPEGGARYRCRLHVWTDTPGGWKVCRSPVVYGGLGDAVWAFEVQAIDRSGRVTRPPGLWLFQIDNAGPEIVFDLRPNDPATNVNPVFEFHANEPIRGGTLCAVDDAPAVDCSEGTFQPIGLSRAEHVVTITATDTLGNTATTTFTWLIQ